MVLSAAAAAAWLFFVDPRQVNILPPCLFHAATGLYCPGCGSMRALHELLHGHILGAIGYNPLMVSGLPILAYAGLSELFILIWGRRLPPLNTSARLDWAILAVILVYWVARNIPVYPFNLLSPHG